MPRPRFGKLDPERQTAILSVAADAFAEHGFRDASYNAIIETCGISKGSFYYYFDDKADLFTTALTAELAAAADGLTGLWVDDDGRSFWEQVETLVRDVLERGAKFPRAVALIKAAFGLPDPEALAPVLGPFNDVVERVIARGQAQGAVRTDLPVELLLAVIMSTGEAMDRYLLERWPEGPTGEDAEWAVQTIVGLFKRVGGT